jgi:hypothetical protein
MSDNKKPSTKEDLSKAASPSQADTPVSEQQIPLYPFYPGWRGDKFTPSR